MALVQQARRPGPARAAKSAAPGYKPDLGRGIAWGLKEAGVRLDDIEANPALALTSEQHARPAEAVDAGARDTRPRARSGQARRWTISGELKRIVGSAYDQFAQQGQKSGALTIGAVLELVLWWPLAWLIPWGGDWLASTLISGGQWQARQRLMREVNPQARGWVARLCDAHPTDVSTELWKAAMAVKAIPPGPPSQPRQCNRHHAARQGSGLSWLGTTVCAGHILGKNS